jgi:hypothetical protein
MRLRSAKFVWISMLGLLLGGWLLVVQQGNVERLRGENASLQRDLEELRVSDAQIERLRLENDALASRLIDTVELARLRANSAELRRLQAAGSPEPAGMEGTAGESLVHQRRSADDVPAGASPTAESVQYPHAAALEDGTVDRRGQPALTQRDSLAPSAASEPSAAQWLGGTADSPGALGFPGGAAVFTGPVTANLGAGQTLLTGGWEIGEGQRGYVLVTPVIDPGAAGDIEQIAFDLRVIRVPESQISADALGEWIALNSAGSQIGVLDAAASADMIAAFEATPDADHANLQVAGTNRVGTHVQFGGSSNRPSSVSLHFTPEVDPAGGNIQLGVIPRVIVPR